MTDTITATSDDGVTFTISNIEIVPAGDRSSNPLVIFTLDTPFGVERFENEILDGYMSRGDGCYIDQRQILELEDETQASDLLYAVNDALRPVVAQTSMAIEELDVLSELAQTSFCRGDGVGEEKWTVGPNNNGHRVRSLHEVRAALLEIYADQD